MYTAIGFVFNKEQPYESASKALSNFCNEIDSAHDKKIIPTRFS